MRTELIITERLLCCGVHAVRLRGEQSGVSHAEELPRQLGRKAAAVPRDADIGHRDLTTKGLGMLGERWLD